MGPFDHPAARFVARLAFQRLRLLPAGADVGRVAEVVQQAVDVVDVVPLVQAEVLRRVLGRLRPSDRDAQQRPLGQLEVRPVRPVNGQAQRDPRAVGEQAAFGAALATVHGAGAGFPPRRAAP